MDSREMLVMEICAVSTIFSTCIHRGRAAKSAFVDWYLILQIGEDVAVDEIRRRYRQLALQLHPDKNKHRDADVAFKLVSEAYACLCDKARRSAFNFERNNRFCTICIKKSQQNTSHQDPKKHPEKKRSTYRSSKEQERQHKVLQTLKAAKRRLEEEAAVIENCLRANEEVPTEEYPVFDPLDYMSFSGYPHQRRVQAPRGSWWLHPGKLRNSFSRKGWSEYPIYENKSISQSRKSRNHYFKF